MFILMTAYGTEKSRLTAGSFLEHKGRRSVRGQRTKCGL